MGAYQLQKLNILLLDTKNQNPNHYICIAIEKALSSHADVAIVIKANLNDALSKALHHKCNLFIAFDGEELNRPICSRLKDVCGKSILWVTEDPYEIKVNISNADLFDLVFTNDSASVSAYGKKGRHLPLAGAKEFHYLSLKHKLNDLRYDAFFAGTAWPNRADLIKNLIKKNIEPNKIRLKLALPTNEHLPKFNLEYPLSQIDWRMSALDFARFSNLSLTTILLPRVFSALGERNFAETPPPRLFETAMSGTVQLVQSNLSEIEKYFIAGEDFIFFNTAEDLIQLIRKLKTDIKWRNSIAKSAQDKALTYHSYDNRVSFMLSELKKVKIKRSTNKIYQYKKNKPRLLLVAHNSVKNGNFGGVETYLSHIGLELEKKYEVYFYVPNNNKKDSSILLSWDGKILRKNNFSSEISVWQLSCSEREAAFLALLIDFDISIVHFHHFLNSVISLAEISKALGVITLFTMHDFYSICHNFTLLSFKNSYCQPDLLNPSDCDICLSNSYNIKSGSQAQRRVYWDRMLNRLDGIIFNTRFSYDLSAKIFPSIAKHKQIFIAPTPIHNLNYLQRNEIKKEFSAPLKVAILGNFSFHKGAEVITRAIKFLIKENIKVEFHIFGRLDSSYDYLDNKDIYPHVYIYGSYISPNIPKEIFSCHLSLHLSIWPETYCLTLSEAWKYGLIPIVSDIGALGERVSHNINGIKIRENSDGDLVEALLRFNRSPELIKNMQLNFKHLPISEKKDHLFLLEKIYDSYLKDRNFNFILNNKDAILPNIRVSMPVIWTDFLGAQINQPIKLAHKRALVKKGIKYLKDHGIRKTFFKTIKKIAADL